MEREPEQERWDAETLAGDPHGRSDKARRVKTMFASIAGSYDLNNRVHAFGMDQRWRDAAVAMAGLRPGDRIVDVACGTGDLAIKLAQGRPADAEPVIGVDFTFPMLPLAAGKTASISDKTASISDKTASIPNKTASISHEPRPAAARFAGGDALRLPLADASADVVTIAFGLRNVADPAAAVAEFARVLRPGGRLVVLEFVEPKNPLIRLGNAAYTRLLMPLSATLLSGDRTGAYRYLPRSVATFLDTAGVASLYRSCGFEGHRSRSLNLGTVDCHLGTRSAG